MSSILEFFRDYTLRNVVVGTFLLGLGTGAVGTFAVLRKQSLLGDVISHAALPGIVAAYLVAGGRSLPVLLGGATLASLLGTLFILSIVQTTRIDSDGAQGIILSVFFGLGLMLLTYTQKLPASSQAGLDRFLFGQAATLIQRDVIFIFLVELVVFLLLILFWKELKLATFHREYAQVLGFPTHCLDVLLTLLLIAVIIIGLQAVGVILITALLVIPAASARQWTDRMGTMAILAALIGGFSGVAGSIISFTTNKLPTGPVIVLVLTTMMLGSLLFGPKRGILTRLLQSIQNRYAFAQDRILYDLYRLALSHGRADYPHSISTIATMDPGVAMDSGLRGIRQTLRALQSRGLITQKGKDIWYLTEEGIQQAKRFMEGGTSA